MQRRQVLTAIGAGLLSGLAGCGGQTEGTPAGADGGNGGGVMTETETETPTDAVGDDGTLVGETDTETPTDTNATGGGTATDTAVSVGDIELGRAESFRMRIQITPEQGGSVTYEGRWHTGDFSTTVTTGSGSVTLAHVDGTSYLVGGGSCTTLQAGQSQYDTGTVEDSGSRAEQIEEWADVTASGTDTIDGEEVYVFEVDPQGRGIDETYTYYISTTTGYTRRVESDRFVADYWDWGNVAPIQAPC